MIIPCIKFIENVVLTMSISTLLCSSLMLRQICDIRHAKLSTNGVVSIFQYDVVWCNAWLFVSNSFSWCISKLQLSTCLSTTRKSAFNTATLTSVLSKTDVNKWAMLTLVSSKTYINQFLLT